MDKNTKIKKSLLKTRTLRSSQKCVVYKFKINESKLSKKQKDELKMMFVEGKWLYNYVISQLDNKDFSLKTFNPLISEINHYDKNKNLITSTFNYLPGSCKQTIVSQIISSLKTIKALKKKGYQKHGKMKFISELTSINLKQYGKTHDIRSTTTMKIQGVSKLIKVSGIQQLKYLKKIDFANAKLLNTPNGFYIALTCYIPICKNKKVKKNNKILGLDFGCQTSITDSNGNKLNISFEESEQLKMLQRKLAKKDIANKKLKANKNSNRRNKLIKKIKQQYQYILNKKLDITNKFIHQMKSYKNIIIQDEQLSKWQKSGYGKKIQHSCLGKIKTKLKQLDNIVVLNKFIPTSKLCTKCGHNHNDLKIYNRSFICPYCKFESDRDIHAAQNMVWIFKNLVGRDTAEVTLEEFKTSMNNYHFDNENKSEH